MSNGLNRPPLDNTGPTGHSGSENMVNTNKSFLPNRPILQNVRILDFSWVLAGPYATRLLADFGAEVIKVQPPAKTTTDVFSQGYYNTWNRNKRSISLNMNHPEARRIAGRLVKICDVVVENFSPHVLSNWELDYPALKRLKPDIILLAMSTAGYDGAWKNFSGFGSTVQALSGLSSLTSFPAGPPGEIGSSYSDHVSALYGSLAVLGALEFRQRTGLGQFIDLSELESVTSLLSDTLLEFTRLGRSGQPSGNRSLQAAPHGIYPCRGRRQWCAIAVTSEDEWNGFKQALGQPVWVNQDAFTTLSGRLANVEELDDRTARWTSALPAFQVVQRLQRAGVPAGLVQNAADLARDPQLLARGFFNILENPDNNTRLVDSSPIRLSQSPARYRRGAPSPDEDNEYVYRQVLGFDPAELVRLKRNNVI